MARDGSATDRLPTFLSHRKKAEEISTKDTKKHEEGSGESVNRRNGELKTLNPPFTDSPFPRLFVPGVIGKLQLKNRILMPAMHIPHGGRRITPMLERFYE